MNRIIAVGIVYLAFGCTVRRISVDVEARMTSFKDAMCKCADRACVDKVNADYVKFGKDIEASGMEQRPIPDPKKLLRIEEDYAKCALAFFTPTPTPTP